MNWTLPLLSIGSALLLAPLLTGVIQRTKAFFGGRHGPPLAQAYYDLFKWMRKGAVYSRTSTWIFRLGPVLGLSAVLVALLVLPSGGLAAILCFPGDFIFLAYALGLMRFVTILAALDTGSAFEGMGASREAQFSLLAEPVLFCGLAALAASTGELGLSNIYRLIGTPETGPALISVLLVAMALGLVLLTENARIPVDDPATHLELTMIHEVMVLDHGGIDLAFIEYGAALKLWLFSSLLAGLLVPARTGNPLSDLSLHVAGIFLVAVGVGITESVMARLRLLHVPRLLVLALALSLAAFFWVIR